MLSYLRQVLKQSFFAKKPDEAKYILLSKPVNLFFERYCLSFYG